MVTAKLKINVVAVLYQCGDSGAVEVEASVYENQAGARMPLAVVVHALRML